MSAPEGDTELAYQALMRIAQHFIGHLEITSALVPVCGHNTLTLERQSGRFVSIREFMLDADNINGVFLPATGLSVKSDTA
jgi:hypothetical protein